MRFKWIENKINERESVNFKYHYINFIPEWQHFEYFFVLGQHPCIIPIGNYHICWTIPNVHYLGRILVCKTLFNWSAIEFQWLFPMTYHIGNVPPTGHSPYFRALKNRRFNCCQVSTMKFLWMMEIALTKVSDINILHAFGVVGVKEIFVI